MVNTMLKDFLGDSWFLCKCNKCENEFFSKKADNTCCNWQRCSERMRLDTSWQKQPHQKVQTLAEFNIDVETYLSDQLSYSSIMDAQLICNDFISSPFMTSGSQIFDPDIFGGKTPFCSNRRLILSQPVLRPYWHDMQPDKAGSPAFAIWPQINGITCRKCESSAFTNVCTEQKEGTYHEHLLAINAWIKTLDHLGLNADHLTLVYQEVPMDWGEGKFVAEELVFVYKGLEIGKAMWAIMPTWDERNLAISDIGFGLERLYFVVSNTRYYYDLMRPPVLYTDRLSMDELKSFDDCRTAVLMLLQGIHPGLADGAGVLLRKIMERVGCAYSRGKFSCVHEAAEYYYDQWTDVLVFTPMDKAEFLRSFQIELDYQAKEMMYERLSLPRPRSDETLVEYCNRMVFREDVDLDEILNVCRIVRRTW